MRSLLPILGSMLSIVGLSTAQAQTAPASPASAASPQMTFFVTSLSPGFGGNLGGLAGADRHCQALASTSSPEAAARTWRAYLSTSASKDQPAVNARDRIGKGPWYNAKGVQIAASVGDLHGDTLEAARVGNRINMRTALDENGQYVNYSGGPGTLHHDILTGSKPDGTAYSDGKDRTCQNWTSGMEGQAQIGHHDRSGSSSSWNSAHETLGCSPGLLQAKGSGGLLYCFAVN